MARKFKVIVFTPVWKRPEILKIWAKGVQRLQEYAPEYVDIQPLCIVSDQEDADLVSSFGFNMVWSENKPLGKKHNAGLEYLRNKEFDYILQLGSDDLITSEYLNYSYSAMEKGLDLFGVTKLYFVEPKLEKACYFSLTTHQSTLIGAGRFISHKAIKKLNYKLWPDGINRGLDMTSQNNLALIGVAPEIINTSSICVLDVKSEVNIWSYDTFGDNYPEVKYKEAIKEFPEL